MDRIKKVKVDVNKYSVYWNNVFGQSDRDKFYVYQVLTEYAAAGHYVVEDDTYLEDLNVSLHNSVVGK